MAYQYIGQRRRPDPAWSQELRALHAACLAAYDAVSEAEHAVALLRARGQPRAAQLVEAAVDGPMTAGWQWLERAVAPLFAAYEEAERGPVVASPFVRGPITPRVLEAPAPALYASAAYRADLMRQAAAPSLAAWQAAIASLTSAAQEAPTLPSLPRIGERGEEAPDGGC